MRGSIVGVDDIKLEFLRDKRRAQHFYHHLSRIYDTWIRDLFWTEEMRTEGLGMAGLEAGMRVLDVGCGTGFLTEGILQLTPQVWGLDITWDQLRRARPKFPVPLVRGDSEHLPYREGTFDAAVSAGSIEYWPDPVAAIREMRRVVKPGGVVMVGGPTKPRDLLYRILANQMMLFYDGDEARAMFEAADLEDIRIGYTGPKWKRDLAIVTVGRRPP